MANELTTVTLNDDVRSAVLWRRVGQTGLAMAVAGGTALALVLILGLAVPAIWAAAPLGIGMLLTCFVYEFLGVSEQDLTQYRLDDAGVTLLPRRGPAEFRAWNQLVAVHLSGRASVTLQFRDGLVCTLPHRDERAFREAVAHVLTHARQHDAALSLGPRDGGTHDPARALVEWEQQVGLRPALPAARVIIDSSVDDCEDV